MSQQHSPSSATPGSQDMPQKSRKGTEENQPPHPPSPRPITQPCLAMGQSMAPDQRHHEPTHSPRRISLAQLPQGVTWGQNQTPDATSPHCFSQLLAMPEQSRTPRQCQALWELTAICARQLGQFAE
ncbi:hypothetical protein DV515_00006778 [Chloebia gouldiae]|uniref:Uncharacterized protein n=1 Tax=Chloebia gouldiae TaxID=44316 RepID=A0A3L8SK86_CHLGU|nr:hypothetical protein DV515_00006778 [Chloebia gouldiae]